MTPPAPDATLERLAAACSLDPGDRGALSALADYLEEVGPGSATPGDYSLLRLGALDLLSEYAVINYRGLWDWGVLPAPSGGQLYGHHSWLRALLAVGIHRDMLNRIIAARQSGKTSGLEHFLREWPRYRGAADPFESAPLPTNARGSTPVHVGVDPAFGPDMVLAIPAVRGIGSVPSPWGPPGVATFGYDAIAYLDVPVEADSE